MRDVGAAREALVGAARRLDEVGLNQNSSGNLSVRVGTGVLVTPSGIPAQALQPEDCVLLHLDGSVVPGSGHDRTPTSEWRIHTAVMAARPGVGAIVHTHSPEATAAAVAAPPRPAGGAEVAVPPVHYVAARFADPEGFAPGAADDHGTGLRVAPYARFGSAELADGVAAALGPHGRACLMANHGAVALADDLDAAVALALDVEWLCGVWRRVQDLGDAAVLPPEEIAGVAEQLRGYGQQPAAG